MLTLLLLSTTPVFAWKHTTNAWSEDDLPLPWFMDDDVEDSLPDGYQLTAVESGFAAWHAAECASMTEEFQRVSTYPNPSTEDARNVIYWDDPGDDLDPGVLGLTISRPQSGSVDVNGQPYNRLYDTDIIFNNDVAWATMEDIDAGVCANETDITGVATHEIGHSWGMAHSCEKGETCTDQLLLDATMFWSVGACDTHQSGINEDDIQGITALYGPYATFTVIPNSQGLTERYGALPLEVCFSIDAEDFAIQSASWNFGDSQSSTELEPCHTYTEKGQFTVAVTIVLEDASCGTATFRYDQLGYIVACEQPEAEPDAPALIDVTHVDGLTYQTVNFTDLSVYGCVDSVVWNVYKGSGESDITDANLVDFNGDAAGGVNLASWSPKVTFPQEGSYVVVMDVGGPGGTNRGVQVVDAVDTRAEGGGCNSAPTGTAVSGLLLAAAAIVRRRR